MSATDVTKEATQALLGRTSAAGGDNNSVSVETVKDGAPPPPNEDAPRSANAPADNSGDAAPAAGELKPNTDSNELQVDAPATDPSGATVVPPGQINEIQNGAPADPKAAASSSTATPADTSSSKPKKKKGIHKVIPF
jgi:hypothetical protein